MSINLCLCLTKVLKKLLRGIGKELGYILPPPPQSLNVLILNSSIWKDIFYRVIIFNHISLLSLSLMIIKFTLHFLIHSSIPNPSLSLLMKLILNAQFHPQGGAIISKLINLVLFYAEEIKTCRRTLTSMLGFALRKDQ